MPALRAESPPSLDPFYYLNNFESVLCSLLERYADLLSPEERRFIASLRALPRASRALSVGLALRNGDLFRASRLRYPEIGDTGCAAAPLLEAGWVDAQPNVGLDELQRLLTKQELLRYFSLPAREGRRTKPELVQILRGRAGAPQPFEGRRAGTDDCIYRLVAAPLFERFRLMFFGNFHQDWSEFVLADLGIFVYEKVATPLQSRAFRRRADIDVFLELHRCRELLHAEAPLDAVVRAMPPRKLDCEWLEERRQRLLFQIARRCERTGDASAALALYSGCAHPGTAERMLRLNRKLGLAGARAKRVRPERVAVPSFELVLERAVSGGAVEWQVRDFLRRQMPGAAAHYVENGLISALFGLLCWRAIFAPIAGAFFHDFHHGPADLSSGLFCRRRQREFADCLAQLESGQYEFTIRNTYADKQGIQSPFVKWNLVSKTVLEQALECFPAAHLKHWFEWMVRDLQSNRSGFPDLVQFWPKQRRYRMIEVKGPGDRLQDNQRRLLEFCAALGMPVSVCHVRWA